ncbi:MAG: hypothetical protein ACOCX3_03015 [Chloroflexota bacterium]
MEPTTPLANRLHQPIALTRVAWLWLLRLLIVVVVLRAIAPMQTRVVLGPPQTVQAVEDHVCVHTDLIHEPEEWKIQRTAQLTRALGASTIVEFFPWAYIETERDTYNWVQADRIVKHAENQGVRIIARLGLVPTWARPRDTTLNTLPEASDPDFADFVEAFTRRYAGRIQHVIIWNEPNLAFEWGFAPVDPARYVRLLAHAYPAAKRGNPEVIVLAGALAPTLEPPGSPNGLDDRLYLEAMYAAGAAAYFDALAIHTYGFTHPPDDPPAPDRLNFRRVELLRDIMTANGDGDKPVYITESGWNDNPRWVHGVRPSQRAAYTVDALAFTDTHWPWAETLCLWILRHPTPRGTHRDNFTLITPDFQLKPVYDAVRAYAHGEESVGPHWLPPPVEAAEASP